MNKFKVYNFSDLYEMSSGISSTPEQAGHGFNFISFKTVFNNYFLPENISDLMDTSEEERKKYSVKKGDIFLTRTSEVIDELGMSCVAIKDYPDTTFSGFLKRLRPKQDNITYHKYLAFYLRSKYFRQTMSNNSIMTLRASLNEQIFSYLKLVLPDYSIQVKIGDLLFSLSEKIELNNKINAELEAMAKTLYDYWFVQFDFPDENGKPYKLSGGKMVYNERLKREVPEGWEVESLFKLTDVQYGFPFSTNFFNEECNGYPVIRIRDIKENNISNYSTESHIDEKYLLKKGDMLIGMDGNFHINYWSKEKCYLNQRIVRIRRKDIANIYIRYQIEPYIQSREKSVSRTTVGHLSDKDLKMIRIIVPSEKIKAQTNNILDNILSKIILNQKQNQELANLRDWLLPMLMNGHVSVGEADEMWVGNGEQPKSKKAALGKAVQTEILFE